MPILSFFLASFTWNFTLGMTWLATPLWAAAKGLSGAEIGLLFSVPAVVQTAINLVGGAYVDRMGGRRIMLGSCALMAIGAVAMGFAWNFATLFAAQMILVLGRATFWPANWSIAALLPGERGVQAGRLNAVSSAGQILGNAACGFVLALGGFSLGFGTLAALAVAALLLGLGTPHVVQAGADKKGGLFDNYRVLLRMPVLLYGGLCAYLSSLPFSLSMSFYPLLLQYLGFGEEASGMLLALRAVGGITAGLVLARFVGTGPASPWPLIAGAFIAAGVGIQPLVTHWLPVGLLMLALGLGSGLITVFFQVTMAELVEPRMLGSAMALGGVGWGVSHLTTPLILGFLSDHYGIAAGFYVLGALSLLATGGVALLRNWAFARTRLASKP
jgi:MFS family permease